MNRIAAVVVAVALIGAVGWFAVQPMPDAPLPDATPEADVPAHDGPNVLILLWDTVRADRLSLYGYDKPTTPRLDAFAEDAVVFERANSPAIWTPPSHASMFTGYAPSRHGVKATYKWLDHHHTTLAEWLGKHGYDTYLFSSNPFVDRISNLTQGFDQVQTTFAGKWKKEARRATQAKLIAEDASTDISPAWKPVKGQKHGGSAHAFKDAAPVARDALGTWLSKRGDTPWFAFVNLMEAHIPRVPTQESRDALMTPEQQALALKTDVAQINLLSYIFGKKSYSPDELAAINGVYDAAVRDLDAGTGEILDALRDAGHLDDTIVIITSDHGENLGDHHMFGHKFSAWQTLVHVPLVVWYPETLKPKRVSHPTSNLNLFSTVLSMVGVEPPDTDPDGVLDLMTQSGPVPAFIEMIEATPVSINRVDNLYGLDDKDRWLRTFRGVVDEDWKLIVASDGEQSLYHLAEDPYESTDVSELEPERTSALQELLDSFKPAPYDPGKRVKKDRIPKTNAQQTQMLKELGYLEDDE
jgi:arylsulfatase A-like enzyme